MKILCVFVCVFVWSNSAIGQNNTEDETVRQWEKLEKFARRVVDAALKQALPTLIRANTDAGISPKCSSSVLKLIFGLRQMRTWAFEMLDAAGKPGGGIMEGTLIAFGSYDQCLNIIARDKPTSKEYFHGKYCTISIHPPVPQKPNFYTMHHKFQSFANFTSSKTFIRTFSKDLHFFLFLSYRIGICIPSTCSTEDIQNVLNMLLKDLDGVTATVVGCETKKPIILSGLQMGILYSIGTFVILVTLATAVEITYGTWSTEKLALPSVKGYLFSMFLSFSLRRSLKRLFNPDSSLHQSEAVHGLRALSLFWIIFGHIFLYSNYQVVRQLKMAVDYSTTPIFQLLVSSPLGYDTFFFLTGYILAINIKGSEQPKAMFYIRSVLHYILRILPGYLLIIAFMFVVTLTNSGPSWHENLDPLVNACKNNWWYNVLFINNFATTGNETCLANSWYIACEFQLYVVGLIVITLMGWTRIGTIINVLLMVLSVSITGVITAYLKLPPTILFSQVDVVQRQEVQDFLFNRPYPHLGPFCLGLALGHILASRLSIKMKNYSKFLGWSMAITCMASVTFGLYEWNFEEQIATPSTTLYAAAHRMAWSIGIAWVVFVCATRNGGVINSILSWVPFRPISRLSVIAFLFHPIILTTLTSHLRERIPITPFVVIFVLCGISCLSLSLSGLCYIILVSPLLEIESLLFGKNSVETEKKQLYDKSAQIARKLKQIEGEAHSDTEKKWVKGENFFMKNDKTDIDHKLSVSIHL